MDVVVWNLDARYRPELEVEIEIEIEQPEEPLMTNVIAKQIEHLFADAWFLVDQQLS